MGSGDGWTICAEGHCHWGRYGAAGVLITEASRVVLQHRAPWTHEGGRWGIPGGARDEGESAVEAAFREADEEAGIDPEDLVPTGTFCVDHGGWSYTTVVARPVRPVAPRAHNAESISVEWIARDAVSSLDLHDGFAAAWPRLQDIPPPLVALVHPSLMNLAPVRTMRRDGIAAADLPSGMRSGSLQRLIPTVEPVTDADGIARYLAGTDGDTQTVVLLEQHDLSLLTARDGQPG